MPDERHSHRRPGTRGMPRAAREAAILEVAGRAFSDRGYYAASMDEIAAAAGVTKPVVYAYFESKERLYVAYIERAGEELLERMRDAADPSLDPTERLRAGTLQFLRFVAERRDGWRVLYAEAAARGGPLAEQIAALRARIARIVERVLAQTIGVGDDERLDAVAHALVGAGESLANWWLVHPQVEPEELADRLIAFAHAATPVAGGPS